jgi:hypothetical protein
LNNHDDILLSLVPRKRLEKLLTALLDENEFLSKGGIRSISKLHETPYSVHIDGQEFGLNYQPGEGNSNLFGGNSNWRGPVWMPMNYLLLNALSNYAAYYQDELLVEFPTGSHHAMNLQQVADELSRRLIHPFLPDESGHRPVNDHYSIYRDDPNFKNLVLFYEYFHGDNARGVGATHQTGWTGVVAELINRISGSKAKKEILKPAGEAIAS